MMPYPDLGSQIIAWSAWAAPHTHTQTSGLIHPCRQEAAMYEVFRRVSAHTIYRTRYRIIARLVSRVLHSHYPDGLDYAREGEGWPG